MSFAYRPISRNRHTFQELAPDDACAEERLEFGTVVDLGGRPRRVDGWVCSSMLKVPIAIEGELFGLRSIDPGTRSSYVLYSFNHNNLRIHILSTAISAGVTPAIRDACPNV
jgi:hypothetical protein